MRLGVPLSDGSTIPWNCKSPYMDTFYVNTKDTWAPPVADEWVRVKVIIEESNLDLYKIHCSGNDDLSYSLHIIGEDNVLEEIKWLKGRTNLLISECRARGYFFSN